MATAGSPSLVSSAGILLQPQGSLLAASLPPAARGHFLLLYCSTGVFLHGTLLLAVPGMVTDGAGSTRIAGSTMIPGSGRHGGWLELRVSPRRSCVL